MSSVTVQQIPADLSKRMQVYPAVLTTELRKAHQAALVVLHKGIPPYPPKPPNSKYVRTGALGAGLGSDMGGGAVGMPTIYKTEDLGQGAFESAIGSIRPVYNEYVIDAQNQAQVHQGRWWTDEKWLEDNTEKIEQCFIDASGQMVAFLNGMNK